MIYQSQNALSLETCTKRNSITYYFNHYTKWTHIAIPPRSFWLLKISKKQSKSQKSCNGHDTQALIFIQTAADALSMHCRFSCLKVVITFHSYHAEDLWRVIWFTKCTFTQLSIPTLMLHIVVSMDAWRAAEAPMARADDRVALLVVWIAFCMVGRKSNADAKK